MHALQQYVYIFRVEIFEDLPHVDVVFVAVGGGGSIAGISAYLKACRPNVTVSMSGSTAIQKHLWQWQRFIGQRLIISMIIVLSTWSSIALSVCEREFSMLESGFLIRSWEVRTLGFETWSHLTKTPCPLSTRNHFLAPEINLNKISHIYVLTTERQFITIYLCENVLHREKYFFLTTNEKAVTFLTTYENAITWHRTLKTHHS